MTEEANTIDVQLLPEKPRGLLKLMGFAYYDSGDFTRALECVLTQGRVHVLISATDLEVSPVNHLCRTVMEDVVGGNVLLECPVLPQVLAGLLDTAGAQPVMFLLDGHDFGNLDGWTRLIEDSPQPSMTILVSPDGESFHARLDSEVFSGAVARLRECGFV